MRVQSLTFRSELNSLLWSRFDRNWRSSFRPSRRGESVSRDWSSFRMPMREDAHVCMCECVNVCVCGGGGTCA